MKEYELRQIFHILYKYRYGVIIGIPILLLIFFIQILSSKNICVLVVCWNGVMIPLMALWYKWFLKFLVKQFSKRFGFTEEDTISIMKTRFTIREHVLWDEEFGSRDFDDL